MSHITDIQLEIIKQWCTDRIEINDIPAATYERNTGIMKPANVKFSYVNNDIEIKFTARHTADGTTTPTVSVRNEINLRYCMKSSWDHLYQPLFKFVWDKLNKL